MALQDALTDIVSKLREGRFPNEQSVSQGIVLRLLTELGWDVWDANVVWPEFRVEDGRADFALCNPAGKPAIFIEVKQPGRAEEGVRQALEYAFHAGVPFVVLVDGNTWSFFLPAEQGSYDERRVYKLDLFERAVDEAAPVLEKYLRFDAVKSGEALEAARKEYRSRNRRGQARRALLAAWHDLVEDGDEVLFDLLSDAVESKVGVRPAEDDVQSFLLGLAPVGGDVKPRAEKPLRNAKARKRATAAPEPPEPSAAPTGKRAGRLVLLGQEHPYANAKEAMVMVLRALAERDGTFLQRLAQHASMQGRKRSYIARTTEDLYPDRPDLRPQHADMGQGWLVATNLNNRLKGKILQVGCEVAGLRWGHDLMVEL